MTAAYDQLYLVPVPICVECLRWQRKLRWPKFVPTYAEITNANGEILWHRYDDMTPALCEQATEHYSRLAIKALDRWRLNGSRRAASAAGRSIIWARVFRCCYIHLTGQQNATEDDMPFGHGVYKAR